MSGPLVFVSGASGYIAQHLVKLLIEKNYRVVGSVRSQEKGEELKAHFQSGFEYEVVPDIGVPNAFDAALEKHPDVTLFFHTASPLRFGKGDIENYFLHPAINGIKNALQAVKEHGKNVERFIFTSSHATIGFSPDRDPKEVVTEETWTNLTWEQALQDEFTGYAASKTFAEKAAWEFFKNENPHFKFALVNPTYVFGPQAFKPKKGAEFNATASIFNSFLALKPTDPLPPFEGYYYDVRDVAKAHLFAAESDKAINQRLLLSAGAYNSQLIIDTLRKLYPELKNLPVGEPDKNAAALEAIDKTLDSSKTANLLGFKPIAWEQIVKDAFDQYFASQT